MKYSPILLFFILFTACQLGEEEVEKRLRPAPTTGVIINYGEEDGRKGDARREWEEKVHRAAPDVNWRKVEYQNSILRHRINTQLRQQGIAKDGRVSLANGQVEGTWKEKGASNVAGSVLDLAYEQDSDAIYTVSAGGSMWHLDIKTETWTLINQELKFDRGLLEIVITADSTQRLVALVAKQPHYSDDNGASWTASDLPELDIDPYWGNTYSSFVANNGRIYLLTKEDYYADYQLLVSDDQGASFRVIMSPSPSQTLEDIRKPNHSDELLLLSTRNNTLETFLIQEDDTAVLLNSSTGQGTRDAPNLLAAVTSDSTIKLMIYNDDYLYQSLDTGRNWSFLSELPSTPWRVGLHMSKANPDYLLLGNVNLEYSLNGGTSWAGSTYWGDYYSDPENKIHADIMHFEEFLRPDSTYDIFVSCHGGLSIATEDPGTHRNLSLDGLRNAQYYNTATKRGSEDYIYAGAQDQGLQFQRSNTGEIERFEQVISGDYGNVAYSHTADRLYGMYPGGGLITWNTQSDRYLDWTDTPGSDQFSWITPFMVVPDREAPKGEVLYIAGGNATGGSGSFLIRAEDPSSSNNNASYNLTNRSINFVNGAGGQITAVGYSPLNSNRLYIGTEEGRFYHSDDAGLNWEPTIDFVPRGFYLYGQAILASAIDSNRVWFGGSGYSNPAVYQSDNGGETFRAINEGLPPTVVLRMAANNDESLLFAATESGPYVYVVAEETWYYLGETDAPAGRYYSVEYLPNSNIARFSTYNRGVWDFEVENFVSTSDFSIKLADWKVFPNPTNGPISIDKLPQETASIRVSSSTGRLIMNTANPDLTNLAAGIYMLTPVNSTGQAVAQTKRVVVN